MTKRSRHAQAPAIGPAGASRRRRGFTAIELTAVATIITILALILLPIVRNRVDQARVVAAEDDMRTIEIAETLARADTGHFFRISDLDGPIADPEDIEDAVADNDEQELANILGQLPASYWDRPIPSFAITGTESSFDLRGHPLVAMWKGPYTRFSTQKFQTLEILVSVVPALFRSYNIATGANLAFGGSTDTTGTPIDHGNGGPILIIRNTEVANFGDVQDDMAQGQTTAIDPWGAPYIFFGANAIATNLPAGISGNESNFGIAAVYSLGPDGLPGSDVQSIDEETYYRESGFIGTGDDLVRTF
jgi:prepilin-type N-terminal cleavage/methylation domain-containing protein